MESNHLNNTQKYNEHCDFCGDDRSPIVRTITIKGIKRNVCKKCSHFAYSQQKAEQTNEFLSAIFATRQSTCGTSDSVLKAEYAARFSMGEGRTKVAKKLKQGEKK